jgi:N-acyl-D-aspartate/D-glutamate deacylase
MAKFDWILRNAKIVDGTGASAVFGDVAVKGDRIASVASTDSIDAARELDCEGLVVAPGFIDPHTHYDAQVLWDEELTPSSWHGVTTAVMGNCGFGVAPTRPQHREAILRTLENVEGMSLEALETGIDWNFESYPEYLDVVDALPKRIHVASLLGHTPLRFFVMGENATEREATAEELAQMRTLLREGLAAGAAGFSTSRSESHRGAWGKPVPSRVASLEEIWELCRVLGEEGRGTIESTWGPDLFVEEFARLARDVGRPVTWAALVTERRNPGYSDEILARIEAAGGDVHPQFACRPIKVQVQLSDPFPFANVPAFGEVLERDRSSRSELYADPAWRDRARREVREKWGDALDRATIDESETHSALRARGANLAEIGTERGLDSLDLMADLALAESLETRFGIVMTNDDVPAIGRLMGNPRMLLGLSDAGAHTSQLCDANFSTVLLGEWCRERGALSLEDAGWRLTGHPAGVYGLAGRGRIAQGCVADLVVFDPAEVASRPPERRHDFPAGADRLVAESRGFHHVLVAGVPTLLGGEELEEARPGRLLRGGRD